MLRAAALAGVPALEIRRSRTRSASPTEAAGRSRRRSRRSRALPALTAGPASSARVLRRRTRADLGHRCWATVSGPVPSRLDGPSALPEVERPAATAAVAGDAHRGPAGRRDAHAVRPPLLRRPAARTRDRGRRSGLARARCRGADRRSPRAAPFLSAAYAAAAALAVEHAAVVADLARRGRRRHARLRSLRRFCFRGSRSLRSLYWRSSATPSRQP